MWSSQKRNAVLSLICCCLYAMAPAQPDRFFYRQGNNVSQLGCGGVVFAPLTNMNHQAFGAGSVLVRKPVNLLSDFSVSFVLDFTDTSGVDGGAFVFQSDPVLLGESYNGLGVKGIGRSVAIIFDAKQNAGHHDPAFDHACIQTGGEIDHQPASLLAGPVSIEHLYRQTIYPPDGDLEKLFQHIVTVNWKAGSKELLVLVDGTVLLKTTTDLVTAVFNGNPTVYWGFVASSTQPIWYPAYKELQFGYMSFSFGDIFPRIKTLPETDTCFGPPVQVFDSSVYGSFRGLSGLTDARWFWNFGDGATATERYPPPHHYTAAGNYTIKFAVTNAFGCTFDTLVRRIELGPRPKADFTYTAACTNTAISFTDKSTVSGGGIFHWEWQFGNNGSRAEQNPVVTFADKGTQPVFLKVRSNLGCESDTVKLIMVEEKPVVQVSYTEDCFGAVQFQASVQNNVPVHSWSWTFGDGNRSDEQNPLHRFGANGLYSTLFQASSDGGCISDTVQQTIPVDVVSAFAGNDTLAVKGQPLQLAATGNGAFHWSPPTGLNNALIATPVATLYTDQTYILTVSNSRGCEARDTLHIKVFNSADFFVPSAFTPNGDGKNDVLHLMAPGLKQLLYFRIYNRWGQLLFESRDLSRGWNGTLRNQPLPSDVYIWIAAGIGAGNSRLEKKGTVLLLR